MASRTEKSTRTAVASFINSTFGKVLAFVSKTAFINVFGREMLGLNGLFSNVISLLCLADLGFGTAMAYSYYKPIAENDTKKIAALNKFYSKVYLIIAAAVSVACFCAGLAVSFACSTPVGATVVAADLTVFLAANLLSALRRR